MYEVTEVKTKGTLLSGLQLPDASVTDVIASASGSIVIIDNETCAVRFCNKQFEHTFGYTADDVHQSGATFLDLLEPLQRDRFKVQLETVKTAVQERHKYAVYKVRNKDGNYDYAYIYASPITFANDAGIGHFYLTIFLDGSNHELPFISFDTRKLFLEQFNKECFGTFEWLLAQNKIFWSDGLYEIYEVEKDQTDIDYGYGASFTHPEDKDRIAKEVQQTMRVGGNIDISYKIITAQRNVKVIRLIGKIVSDNNNQPEKLVGSVRDITEQVNIEDDFKRNVEELNRSNKELEEFAYIASHDLQEPLRKISTFSDRLGEKYKDVLEGEGAMYLERMMASAENMRMLINNLLEFSRVSKSNQPFTPTNFNFILHQVKSDLELVIEETGTIINCGNLPTLNVSMTQIKQLFTNIINNAIKFHKPYQRPIIDIDVREIGVAEALTYNLHPGMKYYRFQITDNGIGFENEYAQKIFQIFQRLHGKAEYPGSGIGLAICKKIVERHNGIIYAENIPEQGARFVFILPEGNITS